ncbi:dihydromonapterin reductase [Neptuniibacter caesariensis]|uniref:Dihydromonapterin reductase n=1 Tax=Neptuniibacter caesariensis TaxID=207954 RepID=A0A7U8C6B8_NEPCE|nr:dihydromonapterin reductase [Neptuniibacter caesariensis]EAR60709.1 oxidoreductase, short chain dehydrogenase/reductase family protein [Neptuniibacter caesariensis]
MVNQAPILITGVGKRIGFALAKHFLKKGYPVLGTYRTAHPQLSELKGAQLFAVDFYQQKSIDELITAIRQEYSSLRAVIHNASDWLPESSDQAPTEIFSRMMQIHAGVPYQINLALADLLENSEEGSDIIHITDYVSEKGSSKHIAYAASKAALSNLTLSFAASLAPKVKVNSIAPSLIMFNPHDDEAYRSKALDKSLLKITPGEQEMVDAVEYLMRSQYMTGRTLSLDGGRPLR